MSRASQVPLATCCLISFDIGPSQILQMPTSLPPKKAEEQVRSWGFPRAYTWTDSPNYHYKPHSHPEATTHLILSGEFTVTYPQDDPKKKETFGPGARIDVPEGKVHEVWIGGEGCTYVIGE